MALASPTPGARAHFPESPLQRPGGSPNGSHELSEEEQALKALLQSDVCGEGAAEDGGLLGVSYRELITVSYDLLGPTGAASSSGGALPALPGGPSTAEHAQASSSASPRKRPLAETEAPEAPGAASPPERLAARLQRMWDAKAAADAECDMLRVRRAALEQLRGRLREELGAKRQRRLGVEGLLERRRAEQATARERLRKLLEEEFPLDMTPAFMPHAQPEGMLNVGPTMPPGIF